MGRTLAGSAHGLGRALPGGIWPWAFWSYALGATVVVASFLTRQAWKQAGADLAWSNALVWQTGVWASWTPVGLLLWALARRSWPPWKTALCAFLLCWVCAPLHALGAAALDVGFSASARIRGLPTMALARAPVDLLVYTALAAALFAQAERRRASREAGRADDLSRQLAASVEAPLVAPSLLVAVGARKIVAPLPEIERIMAAGNYATVVWGEREGLLRTTLDTLELALKDQGFARVHRSTLVNFAHAREVRRASGGALELVLASGTAVKIGRRYRGEVMRRLDSSALSSRSGEDFPTWVG